eukprot:scaffold93740_cov37-Phaeocystis_antarctica.AAC.2
MARAFIQFDGVAAAERGWPAKSRSFNPKHEAARLIIFRNASAKWGKGRVRRCEIGQSRAYIPVAKWGIRARTFGRLLQMRGGVKKHRF